MIKMTLLDKLGVAFELVAAIRMRSDAVVTAAI